MGSSAVACASQLAAGPYHQEWLFHVTHCPLAISPAGNVGGYHATVVETGAPGSTWDVLVRWQWTDAIEPSSGCTQLLILTTRGDAEAVVASGIPNETQGLSYVGALQLDAGCSRIQLVCPCMQRTLSPRSCALSARWATGCTP